MLVHGTVKMLICSTIGKQLVFVTNNSTKSRKDYKKKFDGMGITANEVLWPLPPLTMTG